MAYFLLAFVFFWYDGHYRLPVSGERLRVFFPFFVVVADSVLCGVLLGTASAFAFIIEPEVDCSHYCYLLVLLVLQID